MKRNRNRRRSTHTQDSVSVGQQQQDSTRLESAETPGIVGSSAHPTAQQLELINRYTSAVLEPLEAHEVITIPFIAADNLLNRGLGKWAADDMDAIALLLPGLPFTLDHDWGDVAKTQGLIYDARVVKSPEAPAWAVNRAGNFDQNRRIVAKEGFIQTVCDVAFPAVSQIVQGLRFGFLGAVSMGGFQYKDHACPICNSSFEDKHCPHYLPDPMWGLVAESDNNVAPYYIRRGIYDLLELSQVLGPNLPAAGAIRRHQV
ncbi:MULTISPECIES: hypothetical protein [Cyanophyceae]|uniref:hypothetical protein n=1 Tax=Cyanophyceae TaxID=3028117 RepID=UPI001687F140|nr:hypothetical protein [Trichocoleus sp. FACHB-40]MBD2005627.1 hypothetical protein [Trichocoleus sp. FACHB-40]